MTYLLDVSTLIALLWEKHDAHAPVSEWVRGKHLAVCPITELGFLRISTSAAPTFGAPMEVARGTLDCFLQNSSVEFIPADLRALAGEISPSSGKTTDWYLANLAAAHGMTWATLDAGAKHPAAELVT